jgi:CRISPR/Cas system endoribonuclease Cas6 (RAMP superfamily)
VNNKLHAISVMMATYARKNNSKIKFSLLNESNTEIASQEIEAKKIRDNNFYSLIIPTIPNSKGKRYHFIISSPDAKPGNAVSAYMTDNKQYVDGILMINNTPVAKDLIMKLSYEP